MIECMVNGICLRLDTESSLFSPNHIDQGTRTMLSNVQFQAGQKILDLGCGYGVVGIYAAHIAGAEHVTMADCNPLAVALAKKNAARHGMTAVQILQSDGFAQVVEYGFDFILSNPPYHADFHVPKKFIEGGFAHLKYGGCMVMVTKRAAWYQNKMKAVFGGVKVIEENGYFVFISQKRARRKTKRKKEHKLSRKLQRKYGEGGGARKEDLRARHGLHSPLGESFFTKLAGAASVPSGQKLIPKKGYPVSGSLNTGRFFPIYQS